MKQSKQGIKCIRCDFTKNYRAFLSDSKRPDVCKLCFTDEEKIDYGRSNFSKEMDGLCPEEKKHIIKSLVIDEKKRRLEAYAKKEKRSSV
jgi:hypothetical protein